MAEKLLAESDAHSYNIAYMEQRKRRDIDQDEIRSLRYTMFIVYADLIAEDPDLYIGPFNKAFRGFEAAAKILFMAQKIRRNSPRDFNLLGQTGFEASSGRYFPDSFESLSLNIQEDFSQTLQILIKAKACDPSILDQSKSRLCLNLKPGP
ncbi:MAG: hypothetical protein JWO78_2017 [Micavibrio sp.]|nr:hypothetical protein [Micavibrio sp.]